MTIHFDKVKHSIGVVALAASGLVPALHLSRAETITGVVLLGSVAWLAGVQSEKMFVRQVVETSRENSVG